MIAAIHLRNGGKVRWYEPVLRAMKDWEVLATYCAERGELLVPSTQHDTVLALEEQLKACGDELPGFGGSEVE